MSDATSGICGLCTRDLVSTGNIGKTFASELESLIHSFAD